MRSPSGLQPPRPRWRRGGLLVAFVLLTLRLAAHPMYLTAAAVRVQHDGRFSVTLTFDTLAFALNDTSERIADAPMNALLDGPRAELERRMVSARIHFLRHCQVILDGQPLASAAWQFPTADQVLAWKAANHLPRLPVLLAASLEGQLPPGTHTLAFAFPEIIGTVVLSVERPREEAWTAPLTPGATSPVLACTVQPGDEGNPPASTIAGVAPRSEFLPTLGRFVGLGFTHILPLGLDHVLFVLGLFLLAGRLSTLLWQVTAFTLAHSLTLGLSLYGVVRLPSALVEPLIAFSIVLVAADNLRGEQLRWWRVPVVFGFGLIHGLGFAGALQSLGLSRRGFVPALVGFNLGVELGQLAVILAAFLAVGWYRRRPGYRRHVVLPASAAIGLIAAGWTLARIAAVWH